MNTIRVKKTRRSVIKAVAAGTVLLPLSTLLMQRASYAQEKVDENDPTAKSLNYHHDASAVTDPRHTADHYCHNCQLYQGKEGEDWGSCPIFQGKLVARDGWCGAWVKKTG